MGVKVKNVAADTVGRTFQNGLESMNILGIYVLLCFMIKKNKPNFWYGEKDICMFKKVAIP